MGRLRRAVPAWLDTLHCPPQSKSVVAGLPQQQSNQLLMHRRIQLFPKYSHDVYTGGRHLSKIVGFAIKMAIVPFGYSRSDCIPKLDEISERACLITVITADG